MRTRSFFSLALSICFACWLHALPQTNKQTNYIIALVTQWRRVFFQIKSLLDSTEITYVMWKQNVHYHVHKSEQQLLLSG